MADDVVQLPLDGTGKKADTESLTVGPNTVHRERVQLAGDVAAAITAILNGEPAATAWGVVTRQAPPIDPKTSSTLVATVVPGGTGSVDSTQIGSGKTGKLMQIEASAAAPFKVDIQTVLNAVATTRITKVVRSGSLSWRPPHKDFITQVESATAGFDGFRLLFTNLDTGAAGTDFHGGFLWDEV